MVSRVIENIPSQVSVCPAGPSTDDNEGVRPWQESSAYEQALGLFVLLSLSLLC